MVYCKLCKEHQPEDHLCFMKPLSSNDDREDDEEDEDPRPAKRRKKMKVQRFIFYDFECMLVDKQHVPNLCVLDSVCEHCMQTPMDAQCYYCKHEQVVFSGPDTLQQVGEWMFSGKNKGAICIAHNSQVCVCFKKMFSTVCLYDVTTYATLLQGYDAHLLLDYVHQNGLKPDLIENGKKILSMDVQGMQFIDSLNYFGTRLANLPKIFDLNELQKGYFPHLLSTPENQQYKGRMPPA